ncbi:MAG: hypothetical protein HDT47_09325 [Ruminococcaceae bacterium]|nr:hypothetical protein [Oscillospiraceae bacterium]
MKCIITSNAEAGEAAASGVEKKLQLRNFNPIIMLHFLSFTIAYEFKEERITLLYES